MLELRCTECNWLDPRLWANQDVCNCSHYFEVETILVVPDRSIQLIWWANGKVGEDDA